MFRAFKSSAAVRSQLLRPSAHRASGKTYSALPRLVTIGALTGGAAVYLSLRESTPLLADTAFVQLDPTDPLSALAPQVLGSVTDHLAVLPVADLLKQYIVYLSSSQPIIVNSGPWILEKLEWTKNNVPLVGDAVWSLFTFTMKGTFYDVFVGGATVPECAAQIDGYRAKGVGCLLNYSAEASCDGTAAVKTGVIDAHVVEACTALTAAAICNAPIGDDYDHSTYSIKPTLLAIKLTGLLHEPNLLGRATSALLNSSNHARGEEFADDVLFPQAPELSDEDHKDLASLHKGLKEICEKARVGGVRLLVDAEYNHYQPAIDRFVDLLAEEFNKVTPANAAKGPAIPIVHNTYQCYLRTAPAAVEKSLARADAKGYSWGAKLVRGAYVESERAKWVKAGSVGECVVWASKAETDACFDEVALLLSGRISREVRAAEPNTPGTGAFYASHNGTSTRKVLEALRDDGLAKNTEEGLEVDERIRGRVSFAQLMGMSDNLTHTLVKIIVPAKATYGNESIPLVVKSVPYASVDQALPYLIRRANENQSILQADPTSGRGGAEGERKAVGKEMRRRMGLTF